MSFNIDTLFEYAVEQITEFAAEHQDEVFYAFAIDANLLCFNSVEKANSTLNRYKDKWERTHRIFNSWDELTEQDHQDVEWLLDASQRSFNLDINDKEACLKVINQERTRAIERKNGNPYNKAERIEDLRHNTGDWEYQGFASMEEEHGFDDDAYDTHYYMSDEEQLTSEYGLAMDQLIQKLKDSGVFNKLKTTDDFYAKRVEHNY